MTRCMICGRDSIRNGVTLHRVNRTGVQGVWTCDDHAAQALRTFAKSKGVGEVRKDLVKFVRE